MCDQACLSKSLRCDGIKNCPSGQDELHCGEKEEGTCVQRQVFLTFLSSINLSVVSGTGTTSSNFISILSNLTNFFLVEKKSLKGGHLLVQKVQNQIYQLKIHSLKCFAFVWIQI